MSAGPSEIYLDHAATSPMLAEAVDAMLPYLGGGPGNPSGAHRSARLARRAVDEARDAVAEALGVEPGTVVFCSGGTEADNLAVLGVLDAAPSGGATAVCSAVEHHAVLHPVRSRAGRVVGVGADGRVDPEVLARSLDDTVAVVSVMAANNEVGTVQPLDRIAEVVRDRAPRAVLHSDAVQALRWLDVAGEVAPHVDAMAVSAHKFGGPQGVGVATLGPGVRVAARQMGGGQERERRSGTHFVAGIVATGVAARITVERRAAEVERIGKLRDRLVESLCSSVDGVHPTVPDAPTVAGIAHLLVDGVDSESLLFLLDEAGIAASSASACAAGAFEPSHVLAAMGVAPERARGAVRFSFGWTSTDRDVDRVLEVFGAVVAQLRGGS